MPDNKPPKKPAPAKGAGTATSPSPGEGPKRELTPKAVDKPPQSR